METPPKRRFWFIGNHPKGIDLKIPIKMSTKVTHLSMNANVIGFGINKIH